MAGALEREQPPRGRARVGGGDRVLDRRRGLELDHPVVARRPELAAAPAERVNTAKIAPRTPARAHPREVEVAAGPAVREQRVVVAR